VRREVVNGKPWLGLPVRVVDDTDELLASYIPTGSPFGYTDGHWPTPTGRHPWYPRAAWQGNGVLMLQRPGEMHAIWHFWEGPHRQFAGWYINIQEPFRRTPIGYDTQDLELDIWVPPNGEWHFKDAELLTPRVAEGRFTETLVSDIQAEGDRIAADLIAGRRWWDSKWTIWSPPPEWATPTLPDGWDRAA
jgi:hypothetical protein